MNTLDRAILDRLTLWINQCYEWKLYTIARCLERERTRFLTERHAESVREVIRTD